MDSVSATDLWQAQSADLAGLQARARLRTLAPRAGVDFASNDYLGLAQAPRLRAAVADALARGVAVGSGGSRLLRGNDPEHEALEAEAAAFFGCESTLWFSAGYAGNVALIATLPQREDLVIYDELIHASVHEGLRLTRARTAMAAHNDADAFATLAAQWRAQGHTGRLWLCVESLYSMDGDRAPLDDLAAVAQRHGAILVIDEAHATGVFGPDGRGLAAHLDGRADVIVLRGARFPGQPWPPVHLFHRPQPADGQRGARGLAHLRRRARAPRRTVHADRPCRTPAGPAGRQRQRQPGHATDPGR